MKINAEKQKPLKHQKQTLVLFSSQTPSKNKKSNLVAAPSVSKELSLLIKDATDEKALFGEANETVLFRNSNHDGYKHILVIGLGISKKINHETIRSAAAAATKALNAHKLVSADFKIDDLTKFVKNSGEVTQAIVEGALLSVYNFDEHITTDHDPSLKEITLLCGAKANLTSIKKFIETGKTLAECVNFSRWLGDQPGNMLSPKGLADQTVKAAKNTKLKVTVWDKARIKKEKMGGLYGVSLGSAHDPRFIIMEYNGAAKSQTPVCLVGKGLTFDSGGISIKPSQSMDEMKYDMCGGAAVIGAMLAIAKLKLKVNVIGLVPSSENMPGPLANKPGDILTARNGKTVEVLNTDAEGRLILMDALSYASELKPKAIFDAATLTGAMVISLGNTHTGFFTRNDKLVKSIKAAGEASGERVWQMPLCDDHVSDMKGLHADLSNISSFRGGGSSTAAAFLEQFVDNDIPWAHFDIAGTAWNTANRLNYCPKKGASGVMVRTFVELVQKV